MSYSLVFVDAEVKALMMGSFKDFIKDGSKVIGYLGHDHQQGGIDLFLRQKTGVKTFYRGKSRGEKTFFVFY